MVVTHACVITKFYNIFDSFVNGRKYDYYVIKVGIFQL
jgi:hypothetical protein